ncbi:MAG: serine hydrolase [Pseudomonadota bacterium]
MNRLFAAALALFLSGTVSAQEGGDTPEMQAALAAGYKAHFTCAALYNGGVPPLQIDANELDGIYPDYRDALAALPQADVDEANGTVSVTYSDAMPPRMSVFREGAGCVQLPIGAKADLVSAIPGVDRLSDIPPLDDSEIIGTPENAIADFDAKTIAEETIEAAFDGATFGEGTRTSGVIVVRDGHILAESYARGMTAERAQRTWSVAKSLSATVIGAAVQEGRLGVDTPVLLDAWSTPGDPRAEILLDDFLRMASGLDSGVRGSRTDRVYFGGAATADIALGKSLEAAPGTRFKYSNNDTLIALRALRETFDETAEYLNYPYEAVLTKIGAMRTVMETDWRGDVLGSSQVWASARDLARIGQLYAQDGVWDGERLLPEGWVRYVSSPDGPQPERGAFGYGAQFWLIGGLDGLPDDSFLAAGHRGQYIVIVPSEKFVLVRRGYDESSGKTFEITAFAASVLSALKALEDENY